MKTKKLLLVVLFIFIILLLEACSEKKELYFDEEAKISLTGVWEDFKYDASIDKPDENNNANEKVNNDSNSNTTSSTNDTETIKPYNFSVLGALGDDAMKEMMDPLMKELSKLLDREVILNISPDYDSTANDVVNGYSDFASLNSITYANILIDNPDKIKYIATSNLAKSLYYYEGYIFTKKDANINNLEDAKGKSIAFTDPSSSSGYMFPLAILLDKGIIPEDYFSDIYFLGKHDAVLQAVYEGSVDIGATYSFGYLGFQKENNEPFKILAKTDKIPGGAVVASTNISDDIIAKIQQLLISLDHDEYDMSYTLKDNSLYDFVIKTIKLTKAYEASK